MTKKELALKTIAELRELAAEYGHNLSSRLKSGIVDELSGVMKKTGRRLQKTAKNTSKQTTKTVKTVKKAAKKASKQAVKTAKSVKKAVTKETAKTIKAVKKAFAAGKKAASAASKAAKAAPRKKTSKAKSPAKQAPKQPSRASTVDLKKKDLQDMTVALLKETARKLGLKHSYATKDEFVAALAKDIAKLRSEARKKATRPAGNKKAATTGTTLAKKPSAREKKTAKKEETKPAKREVPKISNQTIPSKAKIVDGVKAVVHEVAETAREFAEQFREKVSAIRAARPKISRKQQPQAGSKPALQDISMPRVASIIPSEEDAAPPVELLAAIAVEPTELFVSWVLDPGHKPSGPVVLRLLEEGGGHFDFPVGGRSGSAYLKVLPGRLYHVEAGMMDVKGAFTTIRRSNPVVMPPGDMQPLNAEESGGERVLPEEFYTFTPQEYGSD